MTGMEELAIYTFPILGYVIFSTTRFLHAIPATTLVGFLLLPPRYSFNIPLLPSVDKQNVIVLTVAVLALAFAPREGRAATPRQFDRTALQDKLPGLLPQARWALVCIVCLVVIGPLGTTLTNMQPVRIPGMVRPGLTFYDIGSSVWGMGLPLLPLLVARKYLGGEEGQRVVLLSLVIAGLLYSLPTLLEVRLSPQLHNWIYGGFPHSWLQHLRGDGFRPVVFLTHGLVLGMFLCMSLLAVLACLRADHRDRRPLYAAGAFYLFVVLVLSKTLGAFLIALVFAPVILLFPVRAQLLFAAAVAAFVTAYPLMRAAGISPFAPVANVVEVTLDARRAGSLRARLEQEEALSVNALRKPLFGWGGYGRVFNINENAQHVSVRDGLWLIIFGERGTVGFLAYFGLLAFPIILLARRSSRMEVSPATAALAVILAANLLDLVPNSGRTVVTMLIAGALIGRLEHAEATAAAGAPAADTVDPTRVPGRAPRRAALPAARHKRQAHGDRPDTGGGVRHPGQGVAPPREARRGEADGARYTRVPAGPPRPRNG